MTTGKKLKRKEEKELKELLRNNYNLIKSVKVNDDWYPTYPKHFVNVHLFITWWEFKQKEYGEIAIVVSGMDDFSMSKRESSTDINELFEKWNKYKEFYDKIPQTTNKKYYFDRGFNQE